MRQKVFLCFLILLLLMGCGRSDVGDGSLNEGDAAETAKTEESDGRYSNSGDDTGGQEWELPDIPEVVEYSQRKLVLPEPVLEEKEQTVTMMVYMVGSDLESKSGAATKDMEEMIQSGVGFNRVNLLLYTGGCEQWFSDIDNENNCIYQMTAQGPVKLKEYKSQSMGDATCLSTFLNWSYKNFKTDSYNLIFWDHGNGPVVGYGKDRLFQGDSLTLQELGKALSESPFKGENKLGFIGFDACLMSSAELACTVSDYADYLVASQEVEPNFGWDYSFLKDCGRLTNKSLAQQAVYVYITACDRYYAENPNFCNDVTLACIDLTYSDRLQDSINALFSAAKNDISTSYNVLAMERYRSRAFGRATTGTEYDLIDLNSLMNSMAETYPDNVAEVQAVVEEMVCYSGHNTTDCCGMSIYYPYFNKKFYETDWKENYQKVNLFSSYQKYLDSFDEIWLGAPLKPMFTKPYTLSENTPGEFSLTLSDDQMKYYLASGYYILRQEGDGLYSPVSYSEDVTVEGNTITANYDGKTLMISDNFNNKYQLNSKVTEVRGDEYYHSARITARDSWYGDTEERRIYDYNTVNGEIQLSVNHETDQVQLMGYYQDSEDDSKADALHSGKKEMLDTDQYMVFLFSNNNALYPQRDENGVMLSVDSWQDSKITTSEVLSIENGMHYTYELLYDDGRTYCIMFDVVDTQARHYCSELMPITLEKTPEQDERELPINDYTWNDPDDPPVIHSGNVNLTLFEAKNLDLDSIPDYGLKIENDNDFPVKVELSDVIINDQYFIGEVPSSDSAVRNYCNVVKLPQIDQIIRLSGNEHLDRLQFSYRIVNYYTGKILSNWEIAHYEIGEEIKPHVIWEDYYGVQAEPKVLVDDEIVKIELIKIGRVLSSSAAIFENLEFILSVTNKSDEWIKFRDETSLINGISFRSYASDTAAGFILPNNTAFVRVDVSDIPHILCQEGISSVNYKVKLYSDSLWDQDLEYNLKLYDNSMNSSESEYPCVYEDDQIIVSDLGVVVLTSALLSHRYRALIVRNKIDEDIYITDTKFMCGVENEETELNLVLSDTAVELSGKEAKILKYMFDDELPSREMSLSFEIQSVIGGGYTTSPIHLDACH